MPRTLAMVAALCFLADVIFLVVTGLATPNMPRLESQPLSFTVILILSALVPSLFSLMYQLSAGTLAATALALFVFFCFFLATILHLLGSPSVGSRVLADFFISVVMIVKGCAIGALVMRARVLELFLSYLFWISLLLSAIYSIILFSQLRLGMLYPGLGGATYQRASYILAQLFAVNTLVLFYKARLQGWKAFFVIALCGVLFLGVLYNGGRGAFLAVVLLSFYYASRIRFTKYIRKFLSLRFTKGQIGAAGLFLSLILFVFDSVDGSDFDLLLRGMGRIFEVVIQFVNTGAFGSSAVSARDIVYSIVLDGISRQPVFGYGPLWESRVVIPPHNIFLSFILQYGVFIGGVLSASLVFAMIYSWRDERIKTIILLLFPSIVYLLFSGSYLQSFEFWLILTVACHKIFGNFGRGSEISSNTQISRLCER